MPERLKYLWQRLRQTVLLMIGVPDYQCYVRHRQQHHPDQPVMSYEEFFKNRQNSRYGDGKMGRCC